MQNDLGRSFKASAAQRMQLSNQKIAGIILFVGAFGFILAMQVAEFIDGASYNVANNYISDLGTFCPTVGPCVELPSHNLFDISIFLVGLAIVLGSYFLYRTFRNRVFSGLLILSGIGAMGVGIFPENFATEHALFSLIVFLFGGLGRDRRFQDRKKTAELLLADHRGVQHNHACLLPCRQRSWNRSGRDGADGRVSRASLGSGSRRTYDCLGWRNSLFSCICYALAVQRVSAHSLKDLFDFWIDYRNV